MRTLTLSISLVLLTASHASADVIPTCPPGQHVVMSPTPPGAMHHGGGGCRPDEPGSAPTTTASESAPPASSSTNAAPQGSGGACAIDRRASGTLPGLALLALLGALARRRRGARRDVAR